MAAKKNKGVKKTAPKTVFEQKVPTTTSLGAGGLVVLDEVAAILKVDLDEDGFLVEDSSQVGNVTQRGCQVILKSGMEITTTKGISTLAKKVRDWNEEKARAQLNERRLREQEVGLLEQEVGLLEAAQRE